MKNDAGGRGLYGLDQQMQNELSKGTMEKANWIQ